MLTPGDSRIVDPAIVLDPSFTFGPPPWWDSYPAIRQKISAVNETFRTTIAVFGTDAAAELPEPMLLLNHLPDGSQFADFRARTAKAFRRSAQQLAEATDVWSVAEKEILRALKVLDELRQEKLRELQHAFSQWRKTIADRREFVPSNPMAIVNRLDRELGRLLSWQQSLRAGVEETAGVIEDWIDTVSSVNLLSADEQQEARRDLLAELRRTFPDSIGGIQVQQTIDDGINAALDAGDVVVMGESTDTATRRYLASRMDTLAQKNVGAILVQVSHDLQPALERFKSTRDGAQLLSDLQSAGIGGGAALADMVAAAYDHDVRVVAFDTRWGHGSEPAQVQIKNHYMAARLTKTLEELDGEKVIALVADEHTGRGLETLTGGVSFDERTTLPPGTVTYRRGEIAIGAVTIPRPSGDDDSTFVFAPPR